MSAITNEAVEAARLAAHRAAHEGKSMDERMFAALEAALPHLAAQPAPVGEDKPVAWSYELATSIHHEDGVVSYHDWEWRLAADMPHVPEGAVRNLTPLFSRSQQAPTAAVGADEDRAEQFIQAAIDSAPEPLRRLGEWLANKLDEDDWKTADRLITGAAVARARAEQREAPSAAVGEWRPIAEADREIATVQTFGDITLRNSYPVWVRDEDGRVYEAVWTDHKQGYWWDLEGESPVDPVEFMPHPLAAAPSPEDR